MPERARRLCDALLAAAAIAILWEYVAVKELVTERQVLPALSDVVAAAGGVLGDPEFTGNLALTLAEVAVGFCLGTALGVLLGFLIGLSDFAHRSVRVILETTRTVPPVVLVPLLILILGPGFEMSVFLVAFVTVWPTLLCTMAGVRDTDSVLLDVAQAFALPSSVRVRRIIVPGTIPFLATGVRIAVGYAFVAAIVSQLVGGSPGLGSVMRNYQNANLVPELYCLVLITGLLGAAITLGAAQIERRVLHWHPSARVDVI